MIVQYIMDVIYTVLDTLLAFQIPQLPDEVYGHLEYFFDYLELGAGILANYVSLPYVLSLFGLLLTVDAAIIIYHFVMWVLRKIPMLGVS